MPKCARRVVSPHRRHVRWSWRLRRRRGKRRTTITLVHVGFNPRSMSPRKSETSGYNFDVQENLAGPGAGAQDAHVVARRFRRTIPLKTVSEVLKPVRARVHRHSTGGSDEVSERAIRESNHGRPGTDPKEGGNNATAEATRSDYRPEELTFPGGRRRGAAREPSADRAPRPWCHQRAAGCADPPRPGSDAEVGAASARRAARELARSAAPGRASDASLLTGPLSTHPLHRQIAMRKEMSVIDSARFMAVITAAEADAMIAVLDAKYKYAFWRPITAIRNGDIDGNAGTEREASWQPIDNTPMHPEYPCAHCMVNFGGRQRRRSHARHGQHSRSGDDQPDGTRRDPSLDKPARLCGRGLRGSHRRGFPLPVSTVVSGVMGRQIGSMRSRRSCSRWRQLRPGECALRSTRSRTLLAIQLTHPQ